MAFAPPVAESLWLWAGILGYTGSAVVAWSGVMLRRNDDGIVLTLLRHRIKDCSRVETLTRVIASTTPLLIPPDPPTLGDFLSDARPARFLGERSVEQFKGAPDLA